MDSLNVYQSILDFPKQCQQVLSEISDSSLPLECNLVKNIVVSGMGGSALGGRVIQYLERDVLKVPIVISTESQLPNFVNKDSLVIASSYSGNTQETISSLKDAINRQAKIYAICTGGELAQISKEANIPGYIFEPKFNPSTEPRMGLGYNIMSIIGILNRCSLIKTVENLDTLPNYLEEKHSLIKNYESLAQQIAGKIPIFIASEHLKGALHCIKNQFNETAKNFSAYFDLPELNHHLFEGLAYPPSNPDNLIFILVNSKYYHPEVAKRYPVTSEIIQKQHFISQEIQLDGPSPLFEVMELIQMGSFCAYYLSQLNQVDPGVIPWVDYFKKAFSSPSG